MSADHVSLREFIEKIIAEKELRRDDQLAALDKALILQAASYPTTRDFNDLKSHVDIELATRAGISRGMIALLTMASTISLVISVTVAILTYMKP